MKDYRVAEIKAGVFLLVMLVALIGVIGVVTGGAERLTTSYEVYHVVTKNVHRLSEMAPVTFAGYPAGYVSNVHLRDDGKVGFDMNVRSTIAIPTDSIAHYQTDGLLGEKFIDIEPKGAGKVAPGGTIPLEVPPSFAQVTTDAQALVQQVRDALKDLKREFMDPELIASLKHLPIEIDGLLVDTRGLVNETRGVIGETGPKATSLVERLDSTAGKLEAALDSTTGPLVDAAKSVESATGNVDELTADAKATITMLNETIAELRGQATDILGDVDRALATIEKETVATTKEARVVLADAGTVLDEADEVMAGANRIVGDNERNLYIALLRVKRALAHLETFGQKVADEPSALFWGDEDEDEDEREPRPNDPSFAHPLDQDGVGPLGPVERD